MKQQMENVIFIKFTYENVIRGIYFYFFPFGLDNGYLRIIQKERNVERMQLIGFKRRDYRISVLVEIN